MNDPHIFRVVDLKQYTYCPRILYYQTVLPNVRPITYKMEEGKLVHDEAILQERRRQTWRSYGLESATRTFNLPVANDELGLSGIIDLLLETPDELIPVDYKNSAKVGSHHKLQLLAYAWLLRAHPRPSPKPIRRGFIYLIPQRKAEEIRFTAALERQLDQTLTIMRRIADEQYLPPPAKHIQQCVDCEFRRFCNDVV